MGYPEIRTEGLTAIQLTGLMGIMGLILGLGIGALAPYVNEEIPTVNGVLMWGGLGCGVLASLAVVISMNERMHDDTPKPVQRRKGKRKA